MRVRLEEFTWAEMAKLLKRTPDAIAVLPVGATEQHGPHLPLGTDSINVDALCVQAAQREPDVYVLPCVPYGVSHNHIDFQGTLTLQPETLIAVVVDVIRSLCGHGFRRVLIVNGHGGNNATLDVAAIKARQALPQVLIGHSYSGALAAAAYATHSTSGIYYHSDEGETSETLAIRPDLVQMANARRDVTEPFSAYYHRYYAPSGEMKGLVSYGLPPTICLSTSGIMGDASLASEEKGRRIVEGYLGALVKVLQDLKRLDFTTPLR
jgi:creatinine amidohydrolase